MESGELLKESEYAEDPIPQTLLLLYPENQQTLFRGGELDSRELH